MNYTHQPVVRTILADLLTPVALYDRLADAPYTYLLESVEGGERWARYSMIGLPARETVRIRDHQLQIRRERAVIEEQTVADPLAWIAEYHAALRPAPLSLDLPYTGGLVGYFAYDTIGYIEKRLAQRPQNDPLGLPDILFMQSLDLAVLDNLRGEVHLISHVRPCRPNGTCRRRSAAGCDGGRHQPPRQSQSALAQRGRRASGSPLPLPRSGLQGRRRQNPRIHHGGRLHAGGAVAAHELRLPAPAA